MKVGREEFHHILYNAFRETSRLLQLVTLFISHSVTGMVRELRFASRDYSSLTASLSAFGWKDLITSALLLYFIP